MKKFRKPGDIKVGVVGYGGLYNMGGIHLNEMKKAGMTPVAVTEIDKKRLAAARKDLPNIETYDSVAKMLKKSDVNLVTIITPHNTHARLAIQCLKAGCHVVTEKPFAITTAECDRMIAEAKRRNLLLSTYHNRHWDGMVIGAVKAVRSGKLGDVVNVNVRMGSYGPGNEAWRSSRTISGGILYDWGVHLLEYSLQVIDDDMTEVSGFAWNGFWQKKCPWGKDSNEDEATALVRFRKGACLSLTVSNIEPDASPLWMTIRGTKATYKCGMQAYELVTKKKGVKSVVTGSNVANEWWRFYGNIAGTLTGKEKLIITPEWARRPIHILDLAVKSAKQKKALRVKYR